MIIQNNFYFVCIKYFPVFGGLSLFTYRALAIQPSRQELPKHRINLVDVNFTFRSSVDVKDSNTNFLVTRRYLLAKPITAAIKPLKLQSYNFLTNKFCMCFDYCRNMKITYVRSTLCLSLYIPKHK